MFIICESVGCLQILFCMVWDIYTHNYLSEVKDKIIKLNLRDDFSCRSRLKIFSIFVQDELVSYTLVQHLTVVIFCIS